MAPFDPASDGSGFDSLPGYEESLRDLFEATDPLVRVTPSRPDTQIEVVLPLGSMFTGDSAAITGPGGPLLDGLAAILEKPTPGRRIELELLLSPARVDGNVSDDDLALSVNRAGALARALSDRGVAAARIGAGLEHQAPGWLRLLFVIRSPDRSQDVSAAARPHGGADRSPAMAEVR